MPDPIVVHAAEVFDLNRGRQVKAAESAKDARTAKIVAVVAQETAVISKLME